MRWKGKFKSPLLFKIVSQLDASFQTLLTMVNRQERDLHDWGHVVRVSWGTWLRAGWLSVKPSGACALFADWIEGDIAPSHLVIDLVNSDLEMNKSNKWGIATWSLSEFKLNVCFQPCSHSCSSLYKDGQVRNCLISLYLTEHTPFSQSNCIGYDICTSHMESTCV